MSFGFSTIIDALSRAVALSLGMKVAATAILLRRDKSTWSRSGAGLWWATKLTPLLAVPWLIAIALIQQRSGDVWVYRGLMLLVVVAVPIIAWRRFSGVRGWDRQGRRLTPTCGRFRDCRNSIHERCWTSGSD